MSRVVLLLEEPSMKRFLDGLLSRLYPDLPFLCVPHEGRTDLERSLRNKLRGWRQPGVRFIVVRDSDAGDCHAVKARLVALCAEAGRPDALVRLACQELEAWYFGDLAALARAFGLKLRELRGRARYRDPDAIVRPSDELERLAPTFQKISGARAMGALAGRENSSRSFQHLLRSIDRFAVETAGSS